MQATANDNSFDTVHVVAAITLLALAGLVLINRVSANVNIKVG